MSTRKRMIWTKEEENLLLSLKKDSFIKYNDILHHFPNRTKGQIKSKYDSLMRAKKNKKHNYDTTPRKRWTEEEFKILRENGTADWDTLLKLLPDRSMSAIQTKLNEHEIKRNELEITPDMERFVYENFFTMTNEEIGKHLGLSKSTVYNIERRLELTPKNYDWYLYDIQTDSEELSITFFYEKMFDEKTKGAKLYGNKK